MHDPNVSSSEIAISIIVPIYNVAPFVEGCLQSIEQQSFTLPCEILLIDDCSTDGSIDICRRFISQHPGHFILLENPQNLGVSATRNRGLDIVSGRYFLFVDPDDLLPSDALQTLHDAAEQYDSTITKGNNTIFDTQRETAARYNVGKPDLIEADEVLTTLYEHEKVRGHPWGKLFRRDKLGDYRFPLGVRMAQDLHYCSEVFSQAKSLLLLDRNVYRYRDRESGSTGSKFKSGSYLDWLDSVESTSQFARTSTQLRAHKKLLVRTMAQLARECRKLPPAEAEQVLETIQQRCERWQIRLSSLLLKDNLGFRSLGRYIKLRLAIREIRHALSRSRQSGSQSQ